MQPILPHIPPPKFHNATSVLVLNLFALICTLSAASGQTIDEDSSETFFRESVLPILQSRCYGCHSHNSGQMESDLALDWKSGWEKGGTRGPAIRPGNPEDSLLMRVVEHLEPDLKMPDEQIPASEREILRKWIQQGAYDPRTLAPTTTDPSDWWSLKPLKALELPIVTQPLSNPIDRFIQHKLSAQGLELSSPATGRELARRLTFDLHGLIPTPQQVASLSQEPTDQEVERFVDELLASPRYAERWARHWLDTIHFADSHGYEHDVGRDNAWPFRDYVIDALHRDLPWSEFIRQQIAVDGFTPQATNLLPALGFLGAGTFDLSTYSTGPVTFDYLDRDDMLTQTMAAFVSTTANCARCHNHKFDPISQEDYYALQAVFAGILKGDIPYDVNATVANRRRELTQLRHAIDTKNPAALQSELGLSLLASQPKDQPPLPTWKKLPLTSFVSLEGATLTKDNEEILVASGHSPDTDTYVITGKTNAKKISAIRLDLYPHDSLPMRGPGRCQNGNLHLSEVIVHAFSPKTSTSVPIKITKATADFNQVGWGIERAIDGDPKTAWGIHPAVGVPHHAVFELETPIEPETDTELTITLKQLHGGSHLLGAFRISCTDAADGQAIAVPAEIESILLTDPANRSPEQKSSLQLHSLSLIVESELKKLPAQASVYAVGTSVSIPTGNGGKQQGTIPSPKQVHLLQRGDIAKPQQVVPPGSLSALTHLPGRFIDIPADDERARRMALADWISHPENVLTWRSIVNRTWHYHFGRGICDTPSDFGRMGGVPSHPELLDWLAVWFRDDAQGSLKKLHRLIVTSRTYRQQCSDNQSAIAIDSDNRLLWRQNRLRLDADSYRDSLLLVAENLDWKMGGPSIEHFTKQPGPQSTPKLDYAAYDWNSPNANRRSIYRTVWRGIPDPMMAALDFPDLGLLAPVRGFTASPLQSLVLSNNPFVLHQSKKTQEHIASKFSTTPEQITEVFLRTYQRNPTAKEIQSLTPFVQRHSLAALCRVIFNTNEFLFIP